MHDGHNTAFSKLRARDASNSRHHHHLSTSTSVTRVMSEDIKPDVKPDVQKIQLQVSFSGNSERFAFEYTCSCLTSCRVKSAVKFAIKRSQALEKVFNAAAVSSVSNCCLTFAEQPLALRVSEAIQRRLKQVLQSQRSSTC